MVIKSIVKSQILAKTGNEAMAEAMRQINPDVVAAYPITPATEIAMIFSQFVADDKVDTDMVTVESEHSAMSATVGAAAAGSRAMTATSSQGLILMAEILPIASALRLPIVMPEVNRAISGPINIHCDHSDTMFVRDAGWIQIFSENSQEAYDNVLQAIKISEHPDVLLPSLVTTDGFVISHLMEGIEVIDDSLVKEYIGKYIPKHPLLDTDNPITIGSLDLQNYFFEHRYPVAEAMRRSKKVILEVGKDFGARFGREYSFFEKYKLDDAEVAIIALGSTVGTAKVVVDELRAKGIKAGVLKIRVFRPFPGEEIAEALKGLKAVAILDRADSFSAQPSPTYIEVTAALYSAGVMINSINYIYGLGGRDIDLKMIRSVYEQLQKMKLGEKPKSVVNYLGLRL
ncbi:MAG: pyruvate ferredoxin oxidoreductase [Candidatus Margulisbacteria bacterium]|nr:pyruvate ferredoxin oxidoreductase [Candidatus Margulisiibacteriota bacterium]